ncbi:type I-E CRISPR-associated protein Cse2/CasB [Streptomyces pseudovenezuelae]|uniref:type I-E CRISPR-associated protein Cse2/CasB n=1 Tax=Streptomyces pseudovenezuelae TaxID=67350 RepID=UPI003816717A
MTNATPTKPLADRVKDLVADGIGPLQRELLRDNPKAVATLARLRRGAGKQPHQVPDLLGLIDTGPLYDEAPDRRPPGEQALTRAEDAVHVAMTLWALHQQSRSTGMHRPHHADAPGGLGAAVRRLRVERSAGDAVRKRFVRIGTAPTLPILAQRLRELVVLLRDEDIPLDYGLLAQQLYQWQWPGGPETVRRAWGRSFHAYRDPVDGNSTAAEASGSDHLSDSNTTSKDAP